MCQIVVAQVVHAAEKCGAAAVSSGEIGRSE